MKIFKIILIVVMVIIAIPLILALFVQKEYAIEREIVIESPSPVVFNYIKHLKNQDNYSKWIMMDPAMKKSFSGNDGEVGFISAWESTNNEVGKGEQEIIAISEGIRIETVLRFIEPFEAQDTAYMTTQAIDSASTRVVWGFNGAFSYPMNLMNLFIDMDRAVGADLMTGLENLKKIMETGEEPIAPTI